MWRRFGAPNLQSKVCGGIWPMLREILDQQLVDLALQIRLMEVCNEIWSAKSTNKGLRRDLAHVRVNLALQIRLPEVYEGIWRYKSGRGTPTGDSAR